MSDLVRGNGFSILSRLRRRRTQGPDYLHRCGELHLEVTKRRFGRRQDLGEIESAVAHVRSSQRLTYDDIERIRDSRIWDADLFGYWPSRTEIEPILHPAEWDFRNLPNREDEAIATLLEVFRQIEPASVVLRFIAPDHYGILSPPVETILGLGPYRRRGDRYKAYLRNLRALQKDRGLASVAMTDMALWVLQVGVVDGLLRGHADYETLQEAYRADAKLRAIQVGNLAQRLFEEMSRPDLAKALLDTNLELAGQIAAIEFERAVKELVGADFKQPGLPRPKFEFRQAVCDLCDEGRLGREVTDRWLAAVETRNTVVHRDRSVLKKREIHALIEAMTEALDLRT